MGLSQQALLGLVNNTLWPALKAEKHRLNKIDRWARWDHDRPTMPRQATQEYREIAGRAQTPWGRLIVTTVAQELYVEGYRRAKDPEDAKPWAYWQANGMDRRQIGVHRSALSYGLTYLTVLPGETERGEKIPVMRGVSPRQMIALYRDPAEDDWPEYAIRCEPAKIGGQQGYTIRVYDDENVYYLQSGAELGGLTYIEYREHNAGVCPVVRFANMLDLEGRADGEIEPFIAIMARINQTVFDRLVVQRFASWVVRTISGMAKPEAPTAEQTAAMTDAQKLKLAVDGILVAEDVDTKFGSLPASPLDGFISAKDADIRDLSAVSQTPPTDLLGQIANLSAESMAAAEASKTRKVIERGHTFGESWEQALRLGAWEMGDEESASDMSAQVRWRDMESRSLAQTADALGKLATMLGVPVEMLWEEIPGWTQQDVERAKALAAQGGALDQLMQELALQQKGTTEIDAP